MTISPSSLATTFPKPQSALPLSGQPRLLFTSCGATEGSLREMYCGLVKRGRVDPLLWYSMVDHLRKRSKPPPRPLLDQLDGIRHNFRNPTQHPDAVSDIQEAQDLWPLTVDAITRMARLRKD